MHPAAPHHDHSPCRLPHELGLIGQSFQIIPRPEEENDQSADKGGDDDLLLRRPHQNRDKHAGRKRDPPHPGDRLGVNLPLARQVQDVQATG